MKIFELLSHGVVSKVSSISVIFVATLVVPYNKAVEAVIVGAVIVLPALPVIFPELIVPVAISTLSFKEACFPFKSVSIVDIFVATLVEPYNKAVEAVIVGAVIVLPTLPVIFPELIAPVVISTLSFKVACFPSNAVCNPLVLAIVKLPSVMVGCFPSNAVCNPLVLAIVKLPSVMVGCFPSNAVSISVILLLH